jgi:hypothetical protein
MALHIVLTGVRAKSDQGAVVPAVRGWPAEFLTHAVGASARVQKDGQPWVTPVDGMAYLLADEDCWLRWAPATDPTAAAAGAAWPLTAGQALVMSFDAGQGLTVAAR